MCKKRRWRVSKCFSWPPSACCGATNGPSIMTLHFDLTPIQFIFPAEALYTEAVLFTSVTLRGVAGCSGVLAAQSTARWTQNQSTWTSVWASFPVVRWCVWCEETSASLQRVKRRNDSYRWNSRLLASLLHTGSGPERRSGRGRTPWCSELQARGDTMSTSCCCAATQTTLKDQSSLLN